MKKTKILFLFSICNLFAVAQPNITITLLDPVENGSLIFLKTAAPNINGTVSGELAFVIGIKNNETAPIYFTGLSVAFPGSSVSVNPIPYRSNFCDDDRKNNQTKLTIQPGEAAYWYNTRNCALDNNVIFFKEPFPASIVISLHFEGHAMPYKITKSIKPFENFSFDFPAKASDLRQKEYWQTASTHATSNYGGQLFAYDMGVWGWDEQLNKWNYLLPGKTDNKVNGNYRIWDKPIYAMAAGTIVFARDEINDNAIAGEVQYDNTKYNDGSGNVVFVKNGNLLMQYAHFKRGSVNKKLLSGGNIQVDKGEFLGTVGNSGSSSAPHLHLAVYKINGNPRDFNINPINATMHPLPFDNGYVIAAAAAGKEIDVSKWVKLNKAGIPVDNSLIWPSATRPTPFPPGMQQFSFHGISESDYQKLFNDAFQSGYMPVWVDGFSVSNKVHYNVIFKPNSVPFTAFSKLNAHDFQLKFNEWVNTKKWRLNFIDTYTNDGTVYYSCIFTQSAGPGMYAYHTKSQQEHQQFVDQYQQQGFAPMIVSVAVNGSSKVYAAIWEKRNVGAWMLKSNLTLQEFNNLITVNSGKMQLVYVNAYNENGTAKFCGIWHEMPVVPVSGLLIKPQLTSSQYQDVFNNTSMPARCITGYSNGNSASYAGLWYE